MMPRYKTDKIGHPGVHLNMPKALTAAAIAKLLPHPDKRIEVSDGITPGLRLVISPTGAKSFCCRYKLHGRSCKVTFGAVDRLTLSEARQMARDAMSQVSRGLDPAAAKQEAKQAAKTAMLVEHDFLPAVLDEFEKRHAAKIRSGEDTMRSLRRELHGWQNRRIQEIRRKDVLRLLDEIADGGRPSTAIKIRAHLSKLFNWAVERDLVPTSPMTGVSKPAIETARDRVLSDRELRLIWRAAGNVSPAFGTFVRVLALTGQRRDEIARMRWDELSNIECESAELYLAPDRTKNKRHHTVPLPPLARALIASMPKLAGKGEARFVFTSTGLSPISGYSDFKARLDAEVAKLALEEAEAKGEVPVAVTPWRLHDLRRTASTGMASLGVGPHIVEAVINHYSGHRAGVAGIYNRATYAAEKRAALEIWCQHVANRVA